MSEILTHEEFNATMRGVAAGPVALKLLTEHDAALRTRCERLENEVALVASQVIDWSKHASRLEAALREIAENDCENRSGFDGKSCREHGQKWPDGFCYPCGARAALAGGEK